MEVVVKVEKLDDDDFENITMEEVELSEKVLPLECSSKRSINKVEKDDTSILSDNIKSNLSLSEAIQPTPIVKPVSTNYAESLTTFQSTKRIYSPPFFKIMQELDSNKDLFIVRCCNCGKLMKSRNTNTANILKHMKKHHPDVAKLYAEYKLEKFGEIKNLNMLNNIVRTDDTKNKPDNSSLVPPKSVSSSCVAENSAQLVVVNFKLLEDLIRDRVEKLVKNTGFKELNNKVNDLFKIKIKNDTESVDMIKALQSKIANLERECKQLRSTVFKYTKEADALDTHLQILENRLLQRKIIVKNIQIFNREQPLHEIEKFFKECLNLYNVNIISCNVLPRSKTARANIETVLVELYTAEDCRLAVSKIRRLKKDDVYIEHALSSTERKCREKLMMVRQELLSRNPNLNMVMRKQFLLINKNKFYWDERYGLRHDILQTVDNYEFTCADHVEDITGIDLKEFLYILHKYDVE